MGSQGALELLTPRFAHPMVKKYAIYQLEQADNEVVHTMYLQFPCISIVFTLYFSGITAIFATTSAGIAV